MFSCPNAAEREFPQECFKEKIISVFQRGFFRGLGEGRLNSYNGRTESPAERTEESGFNTRVPGAHYYGE